MKEDKFEIHGTMFTVDIPNDFACPIIREIMEDPVVTCEGYSYERTAITHWLTIRGTNPVTNQPLLNINLIPNHSLRGAITDFKESIYAKKILELTQLAEQNNSNAQYELGVMYSKYPDMEKSMYWLNKAVEQHHKQAQHDIIQINEKFERERPERERLERERLERERLERERPERERLERDRLERERPERERLERERLELWGRETEERFIRENEERLQAWETMQRLERERPERERLERLEREREHRQFEERWERNRLKRENESNSDRLDRERLERLERLERERFERLERERLARLERERLARLYRESENAPAYD